MATAFEERVREAYALFDINQADSVAIDDALAALRALHVDATRQQLQSALKGVPPAHAGGAGGHTPAASRAGSMRLQSIADFSVTIHTTSNDEIAAAAAASATARKSVTFAEFHEIAAFYAVPPGGAQDSFLSVVRMDADAPARVSAGDLAAASDAQPDVARALGGGAAATRDVFAPLMQRCAAYPERGMSLAEWRAMVEVLNAPPKAKRGAVAAK
jgi:hypothetical protein